MDMQFREHLGQTLGFEPQNVNNTKLFGPAIENPWLTGRKLAFLINAGDMAAGDSITIGFEHRRVGTSTWDAIKDKDGNALEVVEADGGTLENGQVLCELDMTKLDHDGFDRDAVRISLVNAVAQNVLIGAAAVHADLLDLPHRATKDGELTFALQRDLS